VPPVAETEKEGKVWLLMVEDEEKRLEGLKDDKSDAEEEEEEEEKGKDNVVNLHVICIILVNNVCDFVSTNMLLFVCG
jgi:hypothetical protein